MKFKRSERLIDMTASLLQRPYHLFILNDFGLRYDAAKSSISEDLSILSQTFKHQDLGIIKTYPGANGGVKYMPYISNKKQNELVEAMIQELDVAERLLPGGYLYISDLVGNPTWLRHFGKIVASQHVEEDIDAIVTVATKGIPLAQAVSAYLNVPVIIARKDSKVTEGSTISVKYTSQSQPRIVQSMEIVRDALDAQSRVILVDDFSRGGGTMSGMESLMEIFQCEVCAEYVLFESILDEERDASYEKIKSLIQIQGLGSSNQELSLKKGRLFQ